MTFEKKLLKSAKQAVKYIRKEKRKAFYIKCLKKIAYVWNVVFTFIDNKQLIIWYKLTRYIEDKSSE